MSFVCRVWVSRNPGARIRVDTLRVAYNATACSQLRRRGRSIVTRSSLSDSITMLPSVILQSSHPRVTLLLSPFPLLTPPPPSVSHHHRHAPPAFCSRHPRPADGGQGGVCQGRVAPGRQHPRSSAPGQPAGAGGAATQVRGVKGKGGVHTGVRLVVGGRGGLCCRGQEGRPHRWVVGWGGGGCSAGAVLTALH